MLVVSHALWIMSVHAPHTVNHVVHITITIDPFSKFKIEIHALSLSVLLNCPFLQSIALKIVIHPRFHFFLL